MCVGESVGERVRVSEGLGGWEGGRDQGKHQGTEGEAVSE